MSNTHNDNYYHNHGTGDCGCKKPSCPTCKSYAIPEPCCDRCGLKSCGNKCNACGDEGPEMVTDEELSHACSWFWMSLYGNCALRPKRVSPDRFRAWLTSDIDWASIIDASFIENIVNLTLGTQLSGYVTIASFNTFLAKLNQVCAQANSNSQLIVSLQQQIQEIIANQGSGITKQMVEDCIALALQNYYTREEIQNFNTGLQTQIDTLTDRINELQAQLNACDCDGTGGTGGTGETPVTLNNDLTAFTGTECPQSQSRTVTNPDGLKLCVQQIGNGTLTVTAEGAVVDPADYTSFDVSDGTGISFELTGAADENVVGSVVLSYIDGDGNKQNVGGFIYDVTCPDTGGGGGNTIDASFASGVITSITDAGNESPYAPNSNNNDSATRVWVGDLTGLGAAYAGYAAGYMNGGTLDVVSTSGTPVNSITTPSPGEQVVTAVNDMADVTDVCITWDAADEPTGPTTFTTNAVSGQWTPIADGPLQFTLETDVVDVGQLGDNGHSMSVTVKFRYSDGQVLTQTVTLNSSTTSGGIIN